MANTRYQNDIKEPKTGAGNLHDQNGHNAQQQQPKSPSQTIRLDGGTTNECTTKPNQTNADGVRMGAVGRVIGYMLHHQISCTKVEDEHWEILLTKKNPKNKKTDKNQSHEDMNAHLKVSSQSWRYHLKRNSVNALCTIL